MNAMAYILLYSLMWILYSIKSGKINMRTLLKTLCLLSAAVSGTLLAAEPLELRLGVEPGYAPFEMKTPDGALAGFDIDLGTELCQRIQAKCRWVESDFDGLIPALKAKKIDAILSSMSITEQRQKEIDFTDKLYGTPARLIAAKGATLAPEASGSLARQARRCVPGHDRRNLCQGVMAAEGRRGSGLPEPGSGVCRSVFRSSGCRLPGCGCRQ